MRKKNIPIACLLLVLAWSTLVLAANPNPKGQVIIGSIGEIETLNPALSEQAAETQLLNGIFSKLLRLDNHGQFLPDLALEVPTVENDGISKDGLTITFRLRPNVKWHDGQPLTAEDVKFTWELHMHPDVQVVSRAGFETIDSIATPDTQTVVMNLKRSEADFLTTWAAPEGSILPKHILSQYAPSEITKTHRFSQSPIGSGPFKFKEWKDGEYVLLEANTEYYGDGPYLAKVIQKVVPDSNTLLTQLRTGEVDIVQVQPNQYELAKAIPHVKVDLNPASIYQHITLNFDKVPAFKDKLVRQALSYAIPRYLIVQSICKDVAVPATASIAPISWAYNPNIKPYPYDLQKANQLLDAAGWKMTSSGIREKDGAKLTFTISTNSGNITREQIEQVLQQEWKKIGVDLVIQNYEATTFFGDILNYRKFDAALFAWITGSDPNEIFSYHSRQIPTPENNWEGQNYSGYINPEMDELQVKGLTTFDQEERQKIYYRVQEICHDELPMLYLYYYVNVDCYPQDLKNYKPAPYTNGISWNINEWQR